MLPDYDPNDRCEDFTEDVDNLVTSIELSFAIPVHIGREHYNRLRDVMYDIVQAPYNQPKEGVHWAGGKGARPIWSQQDAVFLGKAADPDAPEGGEPTFDHSVLLFESGAREFLNEKEKERTCKRREKRARRLREKVEIGGGVATSDKSRKT